MPKSLIDRNMFSNLNLCQWNTVLEIANLSQKEKKIANLYFIEKKFQIEIAIEMGYYSRKPIYRKLPKIAMVINRTLDEYLRAE